MGSRWPGQETPTLRVDGAARRLSAFARQNDASFDSLRLCDRLSAITLDYVPLCRKAHASCRAATQVNPQVTSIEIDPGGRVLSLRMKAAWTVAI